MQNCHNGNNIPSNKGNKLIGSLTWEKKFLLYTPLLKRCLQQGLNFTKFHCAIKYTPEEFSTIR